MTNLFVILFVIVSASTAYCDETNPIGFNETLEKEKFKEFFIKIYKLRLTPDDNITNATHTRSRRSTNIFVKFYDAEQKRAKWEKIAASDELDKETVNLIAEKAWNPAGKIVRKTFIKGGSIAGGFAGANIGAVLGATLGLGNPAFVIAGVFIGKKFGQELGALAGAIAGDYVNNFIAHNIIADSVLLPLVQEFTSFIEEFSGSDDTNCRSDICSLGYAEYNCKCIACNGPGQYSNKGDSFCRTCPLGSIPVKRGFWLWREWYECQKCGTGYFGKVLGQCHHCDVDGPMKYSDTIGSTACKTCRLGRIPNYGSSGCSNCTVGNFGGADGKCHSCGLQGPMRYTDEAIGNPVCKTCPLGKIPSSSYSTIDNSPTLCVNCPRGKFGKNDGRCHSCAILGPMRYNSLEGQATCIDCPLGSYPNSERTDCNQCFRGTFGKNDGKCYDCKTEGSLKYSDVDGAATCKTCEIGTSPYPTEGPKRCDKCRPGEFGKLDGKCYNCKNEGPMRYSDKYGSTVCNTCQLGTIPELSYDKCKPCESGTYGKNDGKCHDCKEVGPMSYSDIKGASLCKTCPLGSYPFESTQPFMCAKCSLGWYGKSDGKCYKCDGPMSYSDEQGLGSCKTCRVGSQVFRRPGLTEQVSCIYCFAFPGTVGTTRGCLRPDQVVMTSTTSTTTTATTAPVSSTTRPTTPVSSTTRPTAPVSSTTRPTAPVSSTTRPTAPVSSTTRPTAPVFSTTQPTASVSSTTKHFFTIITTRQQTTQPNPVVKTTKQTSSTSNNPTIPFKATSNTKGNYGNQTSSSKAPSNITANHLITVLLSSSLLLILTR